MKGSRVIAMGTTQPPKFKYYSPMPGCAVARYGTGAHIGATRTPTGFVIDTESVVAIPETEVAMYSKEYSDAVRNEELRERTEADYQAQQQRVEEEEKRDAEARTRLHEEQVKAAEDQRRREQLGKTQPVELAPTQPVPAAQGDRLEGQQGGFVHDAAPVASPPTKKK